MSVPDRANDKARVISLANYRDGEEDFKGFGPVLKGIVKQKPKGDADAGQSSGQDKS